MCRCFVQLSEFSYSSSRSFVYKLSDEGDQRIMIASRVRVQIQSGDFENAFVLFLSDYLPNPPVTSRIGQGAVAGYSGPSRATQRALRAGNPPLPLDEFALPNPTATRSLLFQRTPQYANIHPTPRAVLSNWIHDILASWTGGNERSCHLPRDGFSRSTSDDITPGEI